MKKYIPSRDFTDRMREPEFFRSQEIAEDIVCCDNEIATTLMGNAMRE